MSTTSNEDKAMKLFHRAYETIYKTKCTNKQLVAAKAKLYAATTLDEFVAATELFRGTRTRNARISLGKSWLFQAADLANKDKAGAGAAASGSAAAASDKHVEAKPTKPAGWQPVVRGVKQACWCGQEWGEGHEDAAAHDAQSEASPSPLDKTPRIVLASPSPLDKTSRVVLSADEVQQLRAAGVCTDGTRYTGGAAGAARAAPAPVVFDLTQSSEDEAPPAEPPKSSKAAGKAVKLEADDVYTWQMNDCPQDGWHDNIEAAMAILKKKGKCAGFEALGDEATDQLRTLPLNVGEILMNKVRDEVHIGNLDAFIIKHAKHLRNQWGVSDPETIYEEMEAEYGAFKGSPDHYPGDPKNEGERTESDDEAGAPCVYKCDSKGNSIEY
jgi:hypothetical protein